MAGKALRMSAMHVRAMGQSVAAFAFRGARVGPPMAGSAGQIAVSGVRAAELLCYFCVAGPAEFDGGVGPGPDLERMMGGVALQAVGRGLAARVRFMALPAFRDFVVPVMAEGT
mgnify:CR=1 FL=1